MLVLYRFNAGWRELDNSLLFDYKVVSEGYHITIVTIDMFMLVGYKFKAF